MPGLDEDPSEGTEKDSIVGCAEAVSVRRLPQLLLVLEGNADLVKFGLELGVVGREGDETGESTGGILVALPLDEPSRGLGEEDHTDGENETPHELNSDGKLPRSVTGLVFGSIVDDGGKEETDGDCPLITADESTTILIVWVVSDLAMSAKNELRRWTYRIHLGEHSDWYIGTNIETIPTPQPAKTRPTAKRGRAAAAVCMATPAEKMRTARTTDHLLPRKSAAGAAKRAPKKVPADKMETTRDCWDEVMAHSPVTGSSLPNVHNQFSIVWIPEMLPVS